MQRDYVALHACLFFITFIVFGCSKDHEQLYGAWKSEAIGTISQKHDVVIFHPDKVNFDGTEVQVYYESSSGRVNIHNAVHKNSIMLVYEISRDSAIFDRGLISKGKFIRISEEEARKLIAIPAPKIEGTQLMRRLGE